MLDRLCTSNWSKASLMHRSRGSEPRCRSTCPRRVRAASSRQCLSSAAKTSSRYSGSLCGTPTSTPSTTRLSTMSQTSTDRALATRATIHSWKALRGTRVSSSPRHQAPVPYHRGRSRKARRKCSSWSTNSNSKTVLPKSIIRARNGKAGERRERVH